MFDFCVYCLRTFYSRLLFVIFPDKLKRLKQEQMEIAEDIKKFIHEYKNDIDPGMEKVVFTDENVKENKDISRDDISYLEKRNTERKIKPKLLMELDLISQISNQNSKKESA
jgi:hypothetical protein